MKRLGLTLSLLVALVAAAPAAASGRTLTICGRDVCQRASVGDPGLLLLNAVAQALNKQNTVNAPPPQPYFQLRLQGANGGSSDAWYAPKAAMLEPPAGWIELDPVTRTLLEGATQSLEPFSTPKPASARVNGRAAPHPEVYAGLLADLPAADAPAAGAPAARVELRYATEGPWADSQLSYTPTENVVHRSDGWVAVPDDLAAKVETDLRREGVQGRNGWGSALVFGLILTGALFVGWLTFVRQKWWKTPKRRRGPVREPPPEGPRSDSTR